MSALWVILTAVFVLVLLGSLIGLTFPESRATSGATLGCSVVAYIVISMFFVYDSVEAGHAGLIKQFGAYQESTKDAGAVFHWPWQSIEQVRIRNASHEVRMDNKNGGPDGPAGSRESQPVFVVATFNYSLEKRCVRDLYTNYGSSYYDTVVEPRIKQIFKAHTARYKSIAIVPQREKIRRETQADLAKQLRQFCVRGVDFLLKNVGFDPEFEAAIVDKQVATQKAAAEANRIEVKKNIAQQGIETARGLATQTRLQAQADAYANRVRSRNLNRLLVEWERIQKWGKPSQIYLPSDAIVVAGETRIGGR